MREELKHIGLVDEEVNIYLLLLKEGFSKATFISKRLGVARTTIYRFLASLIDKGLISERIENSVRIYGALSPEKIPDILESRIVEIERVVPKLQKIMKKKGKGASVELFQGKEGIKAVLNDVLREKKDYVLFGEAEKFFEELEIFSSNWLRRVEELDIKGKLVCPKGQYVEIAKNEKLRLVAPELLANTTTWVYGDKVAQFILDEPFHVVLIESKSVAKSNLKLFEHLWEGARS